MTKLQKLRRELHRTAPIHDTPVGLVHPYWARKPFNILSLIIKHLSKPGDTIADPFAGSGTTAFAALHANRNMLASDINPLAIFLIRGVLDLEANKEQAIDALRSFCSTMQVKTLDWYAGEGSWIVERERFRVRGEYAAGRFRLEPIEYVLKRHPSVKRDKKRQVIRASRFRYLARPPRRLLTKPVDFRTISLAHNSRIAIPKGAKASHFFTKRNAAFLNLALETIQTSKHKPEIKRILKLLVSSAIPLLRLSDRKASSQWPYWRPRTYLTSRNPIFVLNRRLQAFEAAADWVRTTLRKRSISVSNSIHALRRSKGRVVVLKTVPVQNLLKNGKSHSLADLVLTDPPYSDHTPYLEYSELWTNILGLGTTRPLWKYEIVKTDAPSRAKDNADYRSRLTSGISACCGLVKPGGYLAFYYQDRNLDHWTAIRNTIRRKGFTIREVIPLPKQRRSMKTVISPGKTLDGDLLIICENIGKRCEGNRRKARAALRRAGGAASTHMAKNASPKLMSYEEYAKLIKKTLINE